MIGGTRLTGKRTEVTIGRLDLRMAATTPREITMEEVRNAPKLLADLLRDAALDVVRRSGHTPNEDLAKQSLAVWPSVLAQYLPLLDDYLTRAVEVGAMSAEESARLRLDCHDPWSVVRQIAAHVRPFPPMMR